MIFSDDIKAMLNSMNEGVIIIDTDGIIVYGNDVYLKFVSKESGIPTSNIIGRRLLDLRPGARLPEVVRTGEPMLRQPRRELSDIYYVNMYPIINNGKIIGGLSIVTFIDDAAAFKEEFEAMERRNSQLISKMGSAESNVTFNTIVAKGRKSASCKAYAQRIADTDFPVLVTSENGVGKTVYAKAIHNASSRAEGPFIKVDCLMLGRRLETELFGSEPEQLSNYKVGNIGLIEAARGGTLFIDEISEMPMDIQVRLYESIQNGSFTRVGANYGIKLEARIIAASGVNLEERVAENKFSTELFYLLNTFSIHIPPLRERMDDVPLIVRQELGKISIRMKKKIGITDTAMERLMSHKWPGNIKELQHVLEFSSYLAKNDMITEESLPENIGFSQSGNETTLVERVRAFEKNEIQKMLEFYGNDLQGKRTVASKLGISLASLYAKIK